MVESFPSQVGWDLLFNYDQGSNSQAARMDDCNYQIVCRMPGKSIHLGALDDVRKTAGDRRTGN